MGRLVLLIPLILIIVSAAPLTAQQPASVATSAQSGAISGRVISESGQPLSGVIISASRSSGPPGQRTSSDNEGYFNLRGLDPGLYRLSAGLPGYVSQTPQTDSNNTNLYRPGDSVSLTLVKGGVIAGIVTNISGEPVVNVSVRAFRIRDADGNRVRSAILTQPRMTDDRGYYRIYGLMAGTYIVSAGGPAQSFGFINPFAKDAPTYAPASTRDTAAEFLVRSDQEVTADIRYRGEPGHIISGKVGSALPATPSDSGVRLTDIESHAVIANAGVTGDTRAFQLNGISDGEYEIAAIAGGGPNTDLSVSAVRRITVKGADLTGLELVLAPLGSVSGRIVFETDQKLNCGRRRENAMRETMVAVRRIRAQEKAGKTRTNDRSDEDIDPMLFPISMDRAPNDKGEVSFRNLFPGTYRVDLRLPGAGWYLRELNPDASDQRGSANRSAVTNIAKHGIVVKSGDNQRITVTISEGGAGLRGRVRPGEDQSLPPGLRIYLVPAERENVENLLWFFEGTAAADGTFAIGNIAPGRYWIMAQPAEQTDATTTKSIHTDGALRTKILRDAQALKNEISFKPCERTVDYNLPYSP